MVVFPPPLTLHNGALLLLWVQASSCAPLAMVLHFSVHDTPLPSPSSCFHTANPSPLPETDLRSLSLSTQPLPERLRLWCPGRWYQWSPQRSCCFALLSPAAALFCQALRSLRLSRSHCWFSSFPGSGFLSSFTAPSPGVLVWSHPDSFFSLLSLFSFCLTQLCGGFLALWGSEVFFQHSVDVR